jgi:hypothetical protein
MAYGHAQLLLYRPFLHYVSQSSKSKTADQRAYACASACISVSRNIIHITAEMKKRGLLTGAYWFSMYTTFFAIISILYYVLENPDSPTSHELFNDAMEGKEVLAHFAKSSMAADRCTATLNVSIVGVSSTFASADNIHRQFSIDYPTQSNRAGVQLQRRNVDREVHRSHFKVARAR